MSSAQNKWCIIAKFAKNWKPLEHFELITLETSDILDILGKGETNPQDLPNTLFKIKLA